MIDFDQQGNAYVHWEVLGIGKRPTRDLSIPLSDYLALTKSAKSLEKLRVLIFSWEDANARMQRSKAAAK